jgi:hypothetical protein
MAIVSIGEGGYFGEGCFNGDECAFHLLQLGDLEVVGGEGVE